MFKFWATRLKPAGEFAKLDSANAIDAKIRSLFGDLKKHPDSGSPDRSRIIQTILKLQERRAEVTRPETLTRILSALR